MDYSPISHQDKCPACYTNKELKLEIRRLKRFLHQRIAAENTIESIYRLSCRIDDLVLEYHRRTTP